MGGGAGKCLSKFKTFKTFKTKFKKLHNVMAHPNIQKPFKLYRLVGSWSFQPLRLTYTSILNNTRAAGDSQRAAPRVKRGLFNVTISVWG